MLPAAVIHTYLAIWVMVAGYPDQRIDAKPCVQHRIHPTELCIPRRLIIA